MDLVAEKRDLTERQKLFVQFYIQTFNGAEAARRAGYAEDSAHVQASQLLINPNIMQAVEEARQKFAGELEMSEKDLRLELQKIAMDQTGEKRDRIKAIELLCRIKGMFIDKFRVEAEHTVKFEPVTKDKIAQAVKDDPFIEVQEYKHVRETSREAGGRKSKRRASTKRSRSSKASDSKARAGATRDPFKSSED